MVGSLRWWPWRRVRVRFSRLSLPGLAPGSWRLPVAEVPVSLSPVGITNQPAGAAGRPGEPPVVAQAWRWEEIREVGLAGGWVFVNGVRFAPDTGHLTPRELLALAGTTGEERERRLRALLQRWFRPTQLRRRVRVLIGRTRTPAGLNAVTLAGLVGISAYVAGDVAAWIPTRWSEGAVVALPWFLLGLLVIHLGAVILAGRALRRLRPVRPQKRGANLLSALLLPPQALRLRALAGDGFFPVMHPLAAIVALGRPRQVEEWAFNAVADLRWPLAPENESPLDREIAGWFRAELERRVAALLDGVGLRSEGLLAPPVPDGPASCRYCPRCRDQFGSGPAVCPNGVTLLPLDRR
jgi:hypothetical protein